MNYDNIELPEKGRDKKEIVEMMRSYGASDPEYKKGRTWSLVYYLGEEHTSLLQEASNMYLSANGLNPMAFKSLKRFEWEVVRMTADMLNGDANVVGTMTSGGTESCLLAVKTYRDRARDTRLWISRPEMIISETAHVAWEKGAEYFDVKAIHAPLTKDYRIDVQAVRKLITRNTILILGSAPEYPHGIVDPIEDLGKLALEKNIPLHVDACLGGYLLPFVEKLGYPIPKFDFRVAGVTSMSADTHKYGYSAKGASVLLYRNSDYLKYQMFICENWPGGVFVSPGMLGTRPGGTIAAAWASMQSLGMDGYLHNARIIMETTHKLIDGIHSIPEFCLIGMPHMSVFAYGSKSPNISIYAVADQMESKGWHIDRIQYPEAIHAMVTPLHATIVEEYLADLRDAVEQVRKNPDLSLKGGAATYGMIANIPLRGIVKKTVLKMVMDSYGPEGKAIDAAESALQQDFSTRAGMMFLKLKKNLSRLWGKVFGNS